MERQVGLTERLLAPVMAAIHSTTIDMLQLEVEEGESP